MWGCSPLPRKTRCVVSGCYGCAASLQEGTEFQRSLSVLCKPTVTSFFCKGVVVLCIKRGHLTHFMLFSLFSKGKCNLPGVL